MRKDIHFKTARQGAETRCLSRQGYGHSAVEPRFQAGGQEINRSSDFFEENIRDYEYEVTVNFGLEALEYDDIVLINAPFTREVHDEKFLKDFSKKLATMGQSLL